jgi:hypothetical protein
VDESLWAFRVLAIVAARTFKPSLLAQIVHLLDYSGSPLDISRRGGVQTEYLVSRWAYRR